MYNFNPHDWYWLADDGRVFASARQAIVDDTDTDYLAWRAEGLNPTHWPKDSNDSQTTTALQEAIMPFGLFCDLSAYANAKQWVLATGGFTATINGVPRTFATDVISQGLITGKALRFQQINPPLSVDWQFGRDVGFVTISSGDFITAAIAIADFVQATFDSLKAVFAAIQAETITTQAQVDAASWPANHQ